MRGQISVEFLMITGIAVFILATASVFMYQYTASSGDRTALAQVASIGYQVVDQSKNVFVYGEGSFVTVEASLPEQINSVYVVDDNTLVFELHTSRGEVTVPVFSDVPINGTNRIGSQVHVPGAAQTAHQGRTSYRVESYGAWVQISQA